MERMYFSLLGLLLVTTITGLLAEPHWIVLDPQCARAQNFAGWIKSSQVLPYNKFNQDALLILRERQLTQNNRIVLCVCTRNGILKKSEVVDVFFAALILKKVVKMGEKHEVTLESEKPLLDPKLDTKLKTAENEANVFLAQHKILEAINWRDISEAPMCNKIEEYYCEYELEFYYLCKNGKILGIYKVSTFHTVTQQFCFAVPTVLNTNDTMSFEYVGQRKGSRIEALNELQKFKFQKEY